MKLGSKTKQQKFKTEMAKGYMSTLNVIFITFLATILLNVFSATIIAQERNSFGVKTIVIDPGHGGKDPGAIGTGRYDATEADIVLDVGLKLRDYINKYFPDVKVIMTRETDVFLKLIERTKIANEADADLFISIHCNTIGSTHAHGSETFVLGMHKTEANLEVAKRENRVMLMEEDYEENYGNFDPTSPESMIALSMMQREFLEQSIYFADLVQDQFRERVNRRDRGVKQAGYWVISRVVMPSVLIELGFISNPPEEDFLNSENGKVYMASAVYRAFKRYKIAMEGEDTSVDPDKEEKQAEKTDEQEVEEEAESGSDREKEADDEKPVFHVQLASLPEPIDDVSGYFDNLGDVEEVKIDGVYKYVVGAENSVDSITEVQDEVREKGYKDAFVIAIYRGKRISLREAVDIINN
ncbi:N-acetylmuramoyl-L-alanine amidase [Salibacter halophilus]|uniref:N-acetylmuramoyl-L-alanine amidase n=2 Tax=Salibacter halophilus TaxID=1803916 RepID=A0A6N6M7T1_9FLAO|nr:N-acetylmuramoyl-L-alanine amidase [Salibacter halophilus]